MASFRSTILAAAAALTAVAGLAAAPTADAGPDDTVRVGFAAETITPAGPVPEAWQPYLQETANNGIWGEPFVDLDGDGCYDGATTANLDDPAAAEPHIDLPANHTGDAYLTGAFEVDGVTIVGDPQSAGKWDGLWAGAGFGSQCAEGVLDDTWARAVVFDDGESPVAMVSIDVVGFLNVEIVRLRRELAARYPDLAEAGLEIIVSSTHTHEAVDTMGYWGQTIGIDGKVPAYQAYIRSQILDSIRAAYDAAVPADARFAIVDHPGGFRDSRQPEVIDSELLTAEFVATGTDDVLGTIVEWSNHPEALGGDNGKISSDFPHAIRERMEAERGGTAVFFTGSVGGLMTPLRVPITWTDEDGTVHEDDRGSSYGRMLALGTSVADAAISGLEGASFAPLRDLEVATREIFIRADNTALNALNIAGVFDVPTFAGADSYGADGHRPGTYGGRSAPQFRTEMARVEVGPASFQTVPGELFPELELGFADRTDCETPGDARTGAPEEPVLQDHDGAEFRFVLGLGQDELGYIVPKNDFWFLHAEDAGTTLRHEAPDEFAPVTDAFPEHHDHDGLVPLGALQAEDPCGDGHYEETVSGSSTLAPWVTCAAAELAGHVTIWDDHEACSRDNVTTSPYGLGGSVVDGVFSHPGHDDAPVWGAGTSSETVGAAGSGHSHGHSHDHGHGH